MPTEEELRKQQEQSQQNTVAPEVQQPVQQTAPAVTSTQPTVQTTEPEPQWLGQVGAANTVNSALDFNPGANYINTPLADEHSLPLQILGNNQVHFLQKDKRTPQQTASIAKFLNKAYGTKIPEDGSRSSEVEITKVYNANLDTIPESLYRQGYIAGKPETKPETKEEKTQKLLKEAVEKGRSFLDIYNIANEPPVYDRPRANRIDQNSKASVVADVLKLIGEGVTTKRGGTPITRQTIVPQLNAELQRLNDTYKQEVQAYKKGGFNALMMDEQEKRRSAALKAAREAAIQQIKIKADIEQRQREKQNEFELNKIKTKHQLDLDRDKLNNEVKVKTANISASGRREKKEDEFKYVDQYVNGKVVKVPVAIVNDVAAKERKISMVNETKTENDLFNQHWNKYFDYVNGEFVPKGTAPATTTGATSRASSNNTQPKSRAK